MKLVAAALAGTLVAGVGVYLWRDAELDARQALLLRAAQDQTYAEIEAERLEAELQRARDSLRRLRARLGRLRFEQIVAPDPVAPALTVEPDGRYFGFIKWLDLQNDPPVLVIDFAEFLTGAAAEQEAHAAGDEVLDYYIVNETPKLRTLEIDLTGARVRLVTWSKHNIPDPTDVEVDKFARIRRDPAPWEQSVLLSPYWITVADGEIVRIKEQYLP